MFLFTNDDISLYKYRKEKQFVFNNFVIFITNFSLTFSGYATFIAMYIIVIIYSWRTNNEKEKVIMNSFILTMLIIFNFTVVNVINKGIYHEELFGVKQETINLINKSDNFGTNRMTIWRKYAMIINNYKWFGVGPDSLRYEISKAEYLLNKPYDVFRMLIIDNAHSEPLQIAVTTGLPSMILYFMLVSIIISLFRIVKK